VSIGDSVRNVIAFYGPCSLRKLRKHLREQRFGAIKIGLLRLYFTLRNENLESYHKRVRYYRAC
jgi:hypothetical protein